MTPTVVFEKVSKKFRRGERHDSLRDLVPALVQGLFRPRPADALDDQEFWAVRNVSFEVHRGTALGIIGPNGAGKSTTLKLLTKILKPTAGRSIIRGRVGALIEIAAGFHPDLTGRENIFLQGAIMGMKKLEINQRFDEIVEFAGVTDFIDTPVKRYSSGMNARLGFSIAAHLDPDVLIIDEVLSVGDMLFQQKCYDRMQAFLRQGTAIVFVSHNLPAVSQLCSQVVMLERGQVTAVGRPADVIAQYGRTQTKSGTPSDSAVDIDFRFLNRESADEQVIQSGAKIRFGLQVTMRTRFRGIIGVVVWDLAKSLYVYGATSDSVGLPPVDLNPGDSALYEFEFAANLARGSYAIEVNMFDPSLQQHLARVNPAGTFTIVENNTYNGVANLFLSGKQTERRGRSHAPGAASDSPEYLVETKEID